MPSLEHNNESKADKIDEGGSKPFSFSFERERERELTAEIFFKLSAFSFYFFRERGRERELTVKIFSQT